MISIENAEKIAKSRYRFSISLIIVVCALVVVITTQHRESVLQRIEFADEKKRLDSVHRLEIKEIRKSGYDCEERDRAAREKSIRLAEKNAEEYKKLYLKTMELKNNTR